MRIYRPRAHARLLVPEQIGAESGVTNPIDLPRISSATWEINNHNHADVLDLVVGWQEAGIDPRLLRNAIVSFWMGDAGDFERDYGGLSVAYTRPRFIGIVHSVERKASEGALRVHIKAHDYTSLFLASKPFPSAGVPKYSDTLIDAWQRICDHTGRRVSESSGKKTRIESSVEILRDALEFRGGARGDVVLGTSVAERFGKFDHIAVKQGADAWAVWQQCVGMLGLISFIELDKCIVTTSTDLFEADSKRSPAFIWGQNILNWTEKVNASFTDKGVGLTSFDPISGTTYEAWWPASDELQRRRKRLTTKTGKPTAASDSENYDWFEYHGVTDLERLTEIAKRAYLERSQQEIEGELTTSEMRVEDHEGGQVDLLDVLRPGETIGVKLDGFDVKELARSAVDGERIAYLVARGYTPAAARVVVDNIDFAKRVPTRFLTRSIRFHLEADRDGGKFEVAIGYVNRIETGT